MKLHIGGKQVKKGWQILNIQKKDNVDFVGDISDLSQFKPKSIEEIYASHVLEHVNQKNVLNTLQGVHRVLKKEGKFYISVPDMDILCHAFVNPIGTAQMKFHFMRMMFGGQVDDNEKEKYFKSKKILNETNTIDINNLWLKNDISSHIKPNYHSSLFTKEILNILN